MTTLYNGSLTVQGLFTPIVGPAGITTADTIVSILNNIGYASEQRVMMEIGSYNTNGGNYGNIYKYALGFSNSTNGSGGSFLIQACPVSTNTYSAINPPITLFNLNTANLSLSVSLSITNSISLYSGNNLQFNVASSGLVSFQTNQWHNDLTGSRRFYFEAGGNTTFSSPGSFNFQSYNQIFNTTTNLLYIDQFGSLYANGSITAQGDVTAFSDVRFKENIVTIDSSLEKIKALRGVYYTRIDVPGPRHVGVIAQEVEEILPEVVLTDKTTGNKSVAYANIVGLLIEGMKEQAKSIESLQSTVNSLIKCSP